MLKQLQQKARKIECLHRDDGPVADMAAPVDPLPRPVATPARTMDVLVRPVSTDAQPDAQQLWDEAFGSAAMPEDPIAAPESKEPDEPRRPVPNETQESVEPDFNELRELLHASLVKEEKSPPPTPTDAFNQRMEIVIRNIKEGKVVIDSGYYTEATMKSELKKDKYQSHIIEYWVDVRTSGSLSRSTKEEFNQFVEIIDSGASLPPPTLGDEALPSYDVEDDDDEDDDQDDGDDDEDNDEKEEKEEAVESALEAHHIEIKNIPQVLSEILKLRIKVDGTLEDLAKKAGKKGDQNRGDKLSKHGDDLMSLHDELAEIKADNSNTATPSDETMKKLKEKLAAVEKLTSRITMEQKKLKRMHLDRSKPKKKPAKSERDKDVRQAAAVAKPEQRQLPWPGLVVSDRLLCSIAAGFVDEVREADPDLAEDLRSAHLLRDLHRQSKTKHESASSKSFAKSGLSCPVEITTVEVGPDETHPVLKIADMLQALASCNKLCLLWGAKSMTSNTDVLPKFWRRWRAHDPQHAVFGHHRNNMAYVLPLQLHGDEGQTLKKSGVLVINWQSPLGFGLSTTEDRPEAMSLNYTGNSYGTRFLYSVCHKKRYSKGKSYILTGIMDRLAEELVDAFYNGVSLQIGGKQVTFYLALLGLKGDWPIQARFGNLSRHFARKGVYEVSEKSGFCHLCRAGEQGYNPNDYGESASWRATYLQTVPWDTEGPLCRVPQSPAKEYMHKFDVFHTVHKGVFAELAGSGIVVITDYGLAGPGDIPAQLDTIHKMAVQHCKETNTPLHMDSLTRHLLSFPGDYAYPVGNWFKGADTTAMCSFLEMFWTQHLASASTRDAYLDGLLECLRAGNLFMRTLYGSGLWLSLDRCKIAAESGLAFLRSYLATSHRAFELQRTRFKLTPKFHALIHVIDGLAIAYNSGRRWTLNPLSEATQMDEDFIGRVSSLTTAVGTRQMHIQTLKKYLTNVWTHVRSK
ncbi:unnamed protein product [Symbiodinium sp. CCMP2592]|nr:unnamed protein product [Symbiodinium sp. CCMP2592]